MHEVVFQAIFSTMFHPVVPISQLCRSISVVFKTAGCLKHCLLSPSRFDSCTSLFQLVESQSQENLDCNQNASVAL